MLKSLYKLLALVLSKKQLYLIRGLSYLGRRTKIPLTTVDYVRVATLELLWQEIERHGVPGPVAELGVYQGGFAKYINRICSDRQLYLFDTFEGFDAEDIRRENEIRADYKHQDFTTTSVEQVLALMSLPENCVVRKGYFPDTFSGLEQEAFSFVSIDADLYEPTRRGLEVFYPRLSRGGCILVHDFNNHLYPGCKQAIEEFCRLQGISYTPIPDIGGSVVIRKA